METEAFLNMVVPLLFSRQHIFKNSCANWFSGLVPDFSTFLPQICFEVVFVFSLGQAFTY